MSKKEITRKLSIYINGKEVKYNLSSIGKEIGKLRGQLKHLTPGTDKFIKKSKELHKARKAYAEINSEIRNTNKELKKVNKSIGLPVTGALLAADAIKSGLRYAKQFLVDSIAIAEESRGIEFAYKQITNHAEILEKSRAAARGLVSDLDIKKAANTFKNFNLDLEKLPGLLEFISVRSAQTGDSFDMLFSSAVEGLAKESKLRIDNLGISTKDLNAELEKTPDFLTAVSNIAEREVAKAGTILDEASNSSLRFNTALANAQVRIGKFIRRTKIVPFFQNFATGILNTIGAQKQQVSATVQQRNSLNVLVSQIIQANSGTEKRKMLITQLNEKYPFFLKFLKDEKTDNENLKTALNAVNNMYVKKLALSRVQTKIDSKQKDQAKHEENHAKARIKLNEYLVKANQYFYKGNAENLKSSLEETSRTLKAKLDNEIKIIYGYGKKATAQDKRRLARRERTVEDIRELEKRIIGSNFFRTKAQQAVEEVKSEMKKLEKELGLTKEEVDNTFDDNEVNLGTVGKKKLTKEDEFKQKSRIALQEFLDSFEEEQRILKEAKESDNKDKEEEAELLRLEAKYLKMAEDAGYETVLAAGLTEALEKAKEDVRKKHADKRLKEKQALHDKLLKEDQLFKQKQLKADQDLENAKKRARATGVHLLRSWLGEKSGLYKAFFLYEKGVAINEILNNTSKSLASIVASTGTANAKAIAASPLTAGQPFVTANTLIAKKQALTTKLVAASEIASIVGRGFYYGGYTDSNKTQGYDEHGEIKGYYTHGKEYVVPEIIREDPYYAPTVAALETARKQKLGVQDEDTITASSDNNNSYSNELAAVIERLIEKLDEPLYTNIGDDEIGKFNSRNNRLSKPRFNAKIK